MCVICGNAKEMYYEWWCPTCNKPQKKPVQVLNALQAFRYIEKITGDTNYKDRMMALFCEYRLIDNDSYILCPDSVEDEINPDLELLRKTFGICLNDYVLLHFSW